MDGSEATVGTNICGLHDAPLGLGGIDDQPGSPGARTSRVAPSRFHEERRALASHFMRNTAGEEYIRIQNDPKAPVSIMPDSDHRLHVLIANEQDDRLAVITDIVESLGHEVVGRELSIAEVGALSRSSGADIALVGLGLNHGHALDEVSAIVREAACPVIALLDVDDPSYVQEAAKRGVFAYIVLGEDESTDLQSALDITLRRFAEFHNLEGAFGRRAIIEQAKGILMERNNITADQAFALIRSQSQNTGQKLHEVANAIASSHQLLRATPEKPT